MLKDYTVLDIETTGLEAGRHRITEIAAIKIRDGQPVGEYSWLVKPYRRLEFDYLPAEITELTGITMEMLRNGHPIEETLTGLLSFIGDDVVLGHNLKRFDMAFLNEDFNYFLGTALENELVDSLEIARRLFKQKGGNGLQKLAKKLEVPAQGRAHRALSDCHVTHGVYVKLLEIQGSATKASQLNK
ncbi:MAG: 3'-5' exonuclease [Turicibacter sp.]|nr:3'-5' exonuclease [Turicibacter sp.]